MQSFLQVRLSRNESKLFIPYDEFGKVTFIMNMKF